MFFVFISFRFCCLHFGEVTHEHFFWSWRSEKVVHFFRFFFFHFSKPNCWQNGRRRANRKRWWRRRRDKIQRNCVKWKLRCLCCLAVGYLFFAVFRLHYFFVIPFVVVLLITHHILLVAFAFRWFYREIIFLRLLFVCFGRKPFCALLLATWNVIFMWNTSLLCGVKYK